MGYLTEGGRHKGNWLKLEEINTLKRKPTLVGKGAANGSEFSSCGAQCLQEIANILAARNQTSHQSLHQTDMKKAEELDCPLQEATTLVEPGWWL